MNNLDKAINELLQLMLVDNKPVYLTQLNELYEYLIKEDNVQQQPNAIIPLNFDNNSSSDTNEYINYIKKAFVG
jgi:hypothetical protein